MAESAELKAARARVNNETNALAATLQPIRDKLAALAAALAASMTTDEQAAASADLVKTGDAFQASIDALTAMGSPD